MKSVKLKTSCMYISIYIDRISSFPFRTRDVRSYLTIKYLQCAPHIHVRLFSIREKREESEKKNVFRKRNKDGM